MKPAALAGTGLSVPGNVDFEGGFTFVPVVIPEPGTPALCGYVLLYALRRCRMASAGISIDKP